MAFGTLAPLPGPEALNCGMLAFGVFAFGPLSFGALALGLFGALGTFGLLMFGLFGFFSSGFLISGVLIFGMSGPLGFGLLGLFGRLGFFRSGFSGVGGGFTGGWPVPSGGVTELYVKSYCEASVSTTWAI